MIENINWASARVEGGECHCLTLEALLTRFHNSRCTNPRDAVYSLVSMAIDIDLEDWLPDYSTNSSDLMVFRKAFEHIVHTTQSLEVMCRSNKTYAETATWLPKFGYVYGCDGENASCVRHGDRDESLTTYAKATWEYPPVVYSASGSTRPKIRFATEGLLLFAKGCLIDTIKRMPPSTGSSNCRSCNIETYNFHQWMRVACDMGLGYRDSREILEWFRRSLVGNRTLKRVRRGGEVLEKLSDAWISILEETACFTDSCGCDVFDFTDAEHLLERDLILKAINVVYDADRTFAVTGHSLGFVPRTAREGDFVCILLGCSVPVILRPSIISSGFYFVGECYIHGLMEGEWMQHIAEWVLELDEFEIR